MRKDLMSANEAPNIVMIGGGTGSFTLLQELKYQTPNVTALVNMCDDGGSSGVLRDELGVLPPGDIRQCLVALSNNLDARDMFSHRFGGDGPLGGHSLGNLILSGLEQHHQGDFAKAIKAASAMLDITGSVAPITVDKHTLVMEDDGEIVRGEYLIGHRPIKSPDAHLWLDPVATIHPNAEEAIHKADVITIAPGNLYGSLLPILAVKGVAESLRDSGAAKVVVSNLVTKPGQTDGWHVVDYVHAFERYIGEGEVDVVLYNNRPPSQDLLSRYAADNEFPVSTEASRFDEVAAKAIGDNLVADEIFSLHPGDTMLRRTLIRHASGKVGHHLMGLCAQKAVV